MAKRYITQLLSEKLGTYLDGLDSTQIKFTLSEAVLQMENVTFKEDCLTKLKLPVKIKHGMIKKLDVRVPWRTISSSPVCLTLEGINLLLTPQEQDQWEFSDVYAPDYLAANLERLIQNALLEQKTEAQQSYFDGFKLKILDNIKIKISDVHIRVEHFVSSLNQEGKQSSFGILIKQFETNTTDKEGKEIFYDRAKSKTNIFKRVSLEGLAIYLNPYDSNMVHRLPLKLLSNNQNIAIEMQKSIQSYLTFLDSKQEEVNKNGDDPNLIYILRPLSLRVIVERSTEKPEKLLVQITLDQFSLQFLYNQLKAILVFARLAQMYRSRASEQEKVKQYRFLKNPMMNAVQKWKFAIDCIRRCIRTKNGALTAFRIPKTKIKELEQIFNPLLLQYHQFPIDKRKNLILEQWSYKDQQNFWHILGALPSSQIKEWVKENILPYEKQKNKVKPNQGGGWGSWLYGMTYLSQSKDQEEEDDLDEFFDCDDGTQNEIETRKTTSLEVTFEVKELTLLLAKINSLNQLEGISMYNKGATIFLKGPTLELDQFDLNLTFLESGIDLVTIDRETGVYIDSRSAIQQNQQVDQINVDFEKEPQLTIEIRKGERELKLQGIEYDFKVNISSIIYKHQEDLLIRAYAISNVKIDDDIQTVAVGAFEDLRDTTQNRLHELIYKGKNRYEISMKSPIILLPIYGTFEGSNAPMWVIKTGNMLILSDDQQDQNKQKPISNLTKLQSPSDFTVEDEYDGYKVKISQIGLHYYQSFEIYAQSQKVQDQFQQDVFEKKENRKVQTFQEYSVLEDFEIKMILKTLKKSKSKITIAPNLQVDIDTSPIQINFSSGIYNQLVNFSSLFKISKEKREAFVQEEKNYQLLIKEELQINKVQEGKVTRINTITNTKEENFAVLSGKYLYFFKDQNSTEYLEAIDIKGAEVTRINNQIQIALNGQNNVKLIFIPLDQENQWETKIRQQIFNLLNEQPGSIGHMVEKRKIEIKRSAKNPEQISLKLNFKVPSLKLQLQRMMIPLQENINVQRIITFENWVIIEFTGMNMNQSSRLYDSELEIQFQSITLCDCTMPSINQTLISQSNLIGQTDFNTDQSRNVPSLQIIKKAYQKESSKFQGLLSDIEVTLVNLNLKFMPGTINQVLKFLRQTKLQTRSYTETECETQEKQLFMEAGTEISDLAQLSNQESINEAEIPINSTNAEVKHFETDCSVNKIQNSRIKCKINNIQMAMLHHKYTMELYSLNATSLEIEMGDWYDHSIFACNFIDLQLSDLTNHPYTYNPRIFYETVQNNLVPLKITPNELIRCSKFEFNLLSFSSSKCSLKPRDFSNKLFMRISPFKINYMQEVTMRFIEYFQQRFIDSLTMSDPYKNPRQEFEQRQKKQGITVDKINIQTDFKQPLQVGQMDIEISKAEIFARDRPLSKNAILISSPLIKVSSELIKSTGCFPTKPNIVLNKQRYNVELQTINFWYVISKKRNDRFSLLKQTFNVKIKYETILYSELLEKVDLRQMDKSSNVKIDFDPFLLVFPQAVYTYILRCNDLNFGWSDRLQSEFYCVKWINMKDYYKNLSKVISQRVKIDIPLLSLTLKHTDGSFISELVLSNFNFSMTRYMDGESEQIIYSSKFFILDEQKGAETENKQAIICPLDSPLLIVTKEMLSDSFINNNQSSFEESQFRVILKMKPDGGKIITLNIAGLKIFLKMPLFILLQGYFMNAFPKYKNEDLDKPVWFVGNDPDNTSKMIMKVKINKSLICLFNQPGFKSIAFQGEIEYDIKSENINQVKKAFNSLGGARHNSINPQIQFDNEQEPKNDYVYTSKLTVSQLTPYICSLSHLESGEVDFSIINKRQIFSPLDLTMEQSYQLTQETDKDNFITENWGVIAKSEIRIGKLQFRLSILDLHLILQVTAYASEQMAAETVYRLQEIERRIDQNFLKNQKTNQLQVSDEVDPNQNSKNSKLKKSGNEDKDVAERKKKEFFEKLLNKFQESNTDSTATVMQRLGQTTSQFQKLVQGYTGQSYNERETFLQFITKDILQTDIEPIPVEKVQKSKPKTPMQQQIIQLQKQSEVIDSSESEDSQEEDDQFFDAIEENNQYFNLVTAERKKSIQSAFKSFKTQNTPKNQINNTLTTSLSKSKIVTPKQSTQTKNFSLGNINSYKNIASPMNQSSLKGSHQHQKEEDEDDEFLSARGSFESYREKVESAIERFYSFHEKRNAPTENDEENLKDQSAQLSDSSDEIDQFMSIKEEGILTIRETVEELRNSQSIDDIEDQNENNIEDEIIEVEKEIQIQQEVQIIQSEPAIALKATMQNITQFMQDLQCEQITILAINDYNSGFTPVLQLEFKQIILDQNWEKKSNLTDMNTQINEILINYYNIELGEWEPLLEQTKILYQQQSTSTYSTSTVKFEKPINLNSTEECLKNLFYSYESWMQTPQFFQKPSGKKIKNQALPAQSQFQNNQLANEQNQSDSDFDSDDDGDGFQRSLNKAKNKKFISQMRESFANVRRPLENQSNRLSRGSQLLQFPEIIEETEFIASKMGSQDGANNEDKDLRQNNQQLVTPFSIANYTSRVIKIVRGGIREDQFNEIRNFKQKEFDIVKTDNQYIYVLRPSTQTDYAVTYDRLMGIQRNIDIDDSQRSSVLTSDQNQFQIPEQFENDFVEIRIDSNFEDQLRQKKLQKIKNNEMIGIQLSDLDYVPSVDLNRNTGQNPWVHEISQINTDQRENQTYKNNQIDPETPLLQDYQPGNNQNVDQSTINLIQNKVFYGTLLKGMRKFLIVRAPYCLVNKTSFQYQVRIFQNNTQNEFKFETKIPQGEQIGIDDSFYSNHSIQLRMTKKDNQGIDDQEGGNGWSHRFQLAELFKLPLNTGTGLFLSNNDSTVITTCLKRQSGEINGTTDFVLIPVITVQNCLPCKMFIRERLNLVGQGSIANSSKASQIDCHSIEQSQEKQFHVFTPVAGTKEGQQEFQLEIGIDDFKFTQLDLKLQQETETEEQDIEISDMKGHILKIGIRKQYNLAGFHLIFFAHVCILVETPQALPSMKIYYQSFRNKPKLANSKKMKINKYIMCNQNSDIVIGLKDSNSALRKTYSYSPTLDLKQAGKLTPFTIITAASVDQSSKRYDFICTPRLELANYESGIYTKVVLISPKFVICNMTKTSIEIAQADNINATSDLERLWKPQEKKEWYWPVGNYAEESLRIIIKKVQPIRKNKVDQNKDNQLLKNQGEYDIENQKQFEQNVNEQKLEKDRRYTESDKIKDWNWSKPISLEIQTGFPILICEKDGSRKKIFHISKKIVGATTFIIIKEEKFQQRPTYLIRNNCPNLKLQFQQDGQSIQSSWKLGQMEQISYAHVDPQSRVNSVTFNMTIDKSAKNYKFKNSYCFDRHLPFVNMDQDFREEIQYNDLDNNERMIIVSLQNDGLTKTLSFRLEGEAIMSQKVKSQQVVEKKGTVQSTLTRTTMNIVVNQLSISIIGFTNLYFENQGKVKLRKERNEIALFTISGLNFQNTANLVTNEQKTNIDIQKIQLDNQSSLNPLFHTILEKKDSSSNSSPFLFFVFKRQHNNETNITTVDLFQLKFADHVLRIDDSFLMNIYATISKVSQLNQKNQQNVHPLFMKDSLYGEFNYLDKYIQAQKFQDNEEVQQTLDLNLTFDQHFVKKQFRDQDRRQAIRSRIGIKTVNEVKFNQKVDELPVSQRHWMILDKSLEDSAKLELKNFQVDKTSIDVTIVFRTKDKKNTEESSMKLLQNFGLKLASIDELQLKFDQFIWNDKFINQDDLQTNLFKFYISNAWSQVLKMALSFKLLPFQPSFRHWLDGANDLVYMTKEGFDQNINQGLIGTSIGTFSFLRKFMAGIFCFTQGSTESLSDICLFIAQDQDYAMKHEEEVLTERPKNFVEGLGFGANSFLQSLQYAVFGIFTRPIIETNRNGSFGLLLGTWSGISGVIFKPLSGLFDLMSKSSEGFKNTFRLPEQKQKKGRLRMPRTFYGAQRRIKSYSEDDAFIVSNVLSQIKRGEFSQDHFIDMKLIRTAADNRAPHFLLLSEENLFLIEASQKALVWHIEWRHIIKIMNMKNGLLLSLDENKDYAGRAQVGLPLDGPISVEINEWFGQIMADMIQ